MVSPARPQASPPPTSRTARRASLLLSSDLPQQAAAVEGGHFQPSTPQASDSVRPLILVHPCGAPNRGRRRSSPKWPPQLAVCLEATDSQNPKNPNLQTPDRRILVGDRAQFPPRSA